jgi:hypothetical protein
VNPSQTTITHKWVYPYKRKGFKDACSLDWIEHDTLELDIDTRTHAFVYYRRY